MADYSTYTVGWICALTKELVAAKSFFDEEHAVTLDVQDPADNNSYSFGRMGKHDVVVASLPMSVYGTVSAATVARDMLRTFPNIRVGLMVGIGGGAPSPQHDIRLGDVVVSTPSGTRGGVLHYSRGKAVQHQEFQLTGSLNQPPQLLLTAVGALGADYKMKGHELEERIQEVLSKLPRLKKEYARPVAAEDRLYEISHIHRRSPESAACKDNCGEENLVTREARGDDEDNPMIHYGLIASADILDKDATIRDKLAREQGVLCFEMEAAGLMNHFPCLIIRGICDYSDTHKNKEWQGFAAMTAAAYAKELLQRVLPTKIQDQKPLAKVLGEIKENLQSITASVKGTSETMFLIQREKRYSDVERWLKPPRYSTNVAKARKRRHVDSGLWFINSPVFEEFKAGSRKHLWLHGLAGCGKTVLSSRIFDYLSDTSDIPTLAHYFDFNDAEKQYIDGLLRSLAFQLCQHGGDAALAKLYELFISHDNGSNPPDELQLETYIKSILRSFDRAIILIDALDECRSRHSLLAWIERLAVENVQFLLTARPEDDIQSQTLRFFGRENCLSLDKASINSDIKSYVRSDLDTNPGFMEKALSEDLRNEICTEVGERADGMFRWAACQMDSLAACKTPNAVRKCLRSLPKDLNETYDRMLEGIHPDDRSDSIRLLRFILHSGQPLTPAEAVEILAIRSDEYQTRQRFHSGNRLFTFSSIERYCPGFISIVKIGEGHEDDDGWSIHGEQVHLTHFSVKEYLRQKDTFSKLSSASAITQTSLAYLTDIDGPCYRMCADFAFARRAAYIWPQFALISRSDDTTARVVAEFLLDLETLSKWYRISMTSVTDWNHPFGQEQELPPAYHFRKAWDLPAPTTSGLYHACSRGLLGALRCMIQHSRLEIRPDEMETSLVIAIRGKHPEIVEVLLGHGVTPNASDHFYGSAVYNAAEAGINDVVTLLIREGANANGHGGQKAGYRPALFAASQNGHLEIAKQLLQAGNYASFQHTKNSCPIQTALKNNHTKIVKLLTEWGTCKDINCGLLESAAYYGKIEMVHTLLECRPDDRCKSRALSKACEAGQVDIVHLLLSSGAEIDYNCPVDNCLTLGIESGNELVVKMLFDNRSEIYKEQFAKVAVLKALEGCHQGLIRTLVDIIEAFGHINASHINILRAASELRHEYILRHFAVLFSDQTTVDRLGFFGVMDLLYDILLGGNKHILQPLLKEAKEWYFDKDEEGELLSPIAIAASTGNAIAVAQLIDEGIDITHKGSALIYAAAEGHEHVVRLLLKRKVDVNLKIENDFHETGGSPLLASLAGKVRSDLIVLMLLDHGADYNHQDLYGNCALHLAAKYGKLSIVEKLLELGDDVNKRNGENEAPLHLAYKDVIPALLAAGASVNARDSHNRTPLHYNAYRGTVDGVKLLLSYGADGSARRHTGTTALHEVLRSKQASNSEVVRLVELLLESGVDATEVDASGSSPLHYACYGSRVDAASLLLKRGVNVNQKNNKGISPFQFATCGHVSEATVSLVSLLVKYGADANTQDNEGDTALHYSYSDIDKSSSMAELLLDFGVEIDTQNLRGESALFGVLNSDSDLDIGKLLIERGANVNISNAEGDTVLHKADDRIFGIFDMLLRYGANLDALNRNGNSPLAELYRKGDKAKRVAQMLVEKGGKDIQGGKEN